MLIMPDPADDPAKQMEKLTGGTVGVGTEVKPDAGGAPPTKEDKAMK